MGLFIAYKASFLLGDAKDFVRTEEVPLGDHLESVQLQSSIADGDAEVFMQLRILSEELDQQEQRELVPVDPQDEEVRRYVRI